MKFTAEYLHTVRYLVTVETESDDEPTLTQISDSWLQGNREVMEEWDDYQNVRLDDGQ